MPRLPSGRPSGALPRSQSGLRASFLRSDKRRCFGSARVRLRSGLAAPRFPDLLTLGPSGWEHTAPPADFHPAVVAARGHEDYAATPSHISDIPLAFVPPPQS